MSKRKNWNIRLESDSKDKENYMEISKNMPKKRIPIYARLIISGVIYIIIYSLLNFSLPNLANYINQITCFLLAILGFIFTSYKDHKNKLYNEIYGRRN